MNQSHSNARNFSSDYGLQWFCRKFWCWRAQQSAKNAGKRGEKPPLTHNGGFHILPPHESHDRPPRRDKGLSTQRLFKAVACRSGLHGIHVEGSALGKSAEPSFLRTTERFCRQGSLRFASDTVARLSVAGEQFFSR